MKKVSVIAAAVATALASGYVFAETDVALDVTSGDSAMEVEVKNPTEVVSDGWEVHGYMSSNYRLVEGESVDTEFGRNDILTGGTSGKSTMQTEFVVKKASTYGNGVQADYNLRVEYGNGNSYAMSSNGGQQDNFEKGEFEVKEAFINLKGILGEETSLWAGHRYFNRASTLLTGEFWKQSSGLGAGIETKLMDKTAGIAYISMDTNRNANSDRPTLHTLDAYWYGLDAGIGSVDLDLKVLSKANAVDQEADKGFGAGITLNTSYYGLDGWVQTGIAYGSGLAANKGLNIGEHSGAYLEDSEGLFITSYGVVNVSDNLQVATEVVYSDNDGGFHGLEGRELFFAGVRPSYKLSPNLRVEGTVSYSDEKLTGEDAWSLSKADGSTMTYEVALPVSVNSDYFGRPQIKPYVTYYDTDHGARIGIGEQETETVVGIHTEIWF